MMPRANRLWWVVRVSWPLLGGAWGAWVGFGGYLRLPQNADSFRMLFALVFFSFFAWVGFFVGMMLGALIGGAARKAVAPFWRRRGCGSLRGDAGEYLCALAKRGCFSRRLPGLASFDR
jgi:hypothetical protein